MCSGRNHHLEYDKQCIPLVALHIEHTWWCLFLHHSCNCDAFFPCWPRNPPCPEPLAREIWGHAYPWWCFFIITTTVISSSIFMTQKSTLPWATYVTHDSLGKVGEYLLTHSDSPLSFKGAATGLDPGASSRLWVCSEMSVVVFRWAFNCDVTWKVIGCQHLTRHWAIPLSLK